MQNMQKKDTELPTCRIIGSDRDSIGQLKSWTMHSHTYKGSRDSKQELTSPMGSLINSIPINLGPVSSWTLIQLVDLAGSYNYDWLLIKKKKTMIALNLEKHPTYPGPRP